MFIQLVDHLRCLRPHRDSWLVALWSRMEDRRIVEGVLGCPVCGAEYPVHDGVADFTGDAEGADGAAGAAPVTPAAHPSGEPQGAADEALRLAALLHLLDVGAPVLLAGRWSVCAPPLADAVRASFYLLNPAGPVPAYQALSPLRAAGALPIAPGTLHGAALDAATAADAGLLAGAARALRPRGRLVAPAGVPIPEGLTELARDERHWVAESAVPASAPVSLRRAGPR